MTGSIALAIWRHCQIFAAGGQFLTADVVVFRRHTHGSGVARELLKGLLGLPSASRRATCNLVEAAAAAVLWERNWRKISRRVWKNAFGVV